MKKFLLAIVFVLSVIVSLNLVAIIAINVNDLIKYWNERDVRARLELVKEIREGISDYDKDNYHMKCEQNSGDSISYVEVFKKDNKILKISQNGEHLIKEYKDSENDINIIIAGDVVSENNAFLEVKPQKYEFLIEYESDKEMIEHLKDCDISTEKYNGEDVYVFKISWESYDNSYKKTSYVNKENGLVLYEFVEYREFDLKGNEFWTQNSYEKYTYEFGTVTEDDVTFPDLSEYKVITSQSYQYEIKDDEE